MKVAFFETVNTNPHLETSLELAKRHLDSSDQVAYHFLGHAIPYTDFIHSKKARKLSIFLPERRGVRRLGGGVKFFSPKSIVHLGRDAKYNFGDIEELKRYKYKNYLAGMASLSSLISYRKISMPDLNDERELLRDIITSGVAVYNYTLSKIAEDRPDLIYLFNGRFANSRAVIDAAEASGVPYLVHERGANMFRYVARQYTPHNFEKIKDEIKLAWETSQETESTRIAKVFFEDRRRGIEQAWKSFTSGQTVSFSRREVANYRKVLVYFSSSDDEYASVGDLVKWDRWPNQATAVEDLIRVVEKKEDVLLILRLHPNMKNKAAADLKYWESLKLPPNVRLVLPTSEINSYSLMDAADVVLTCGSTVGIEAVYWGVPSICMGPSLYSNLDAVYQPADPAELERLLFGEKLSVVQSRSYPYGFYMQTFGEEFRFYKPKGLLSGSFMGVDLQSPSALERALQLVAFGPAGKVKRGLAALFSVSTHKSA